MLEKILAIKEKTFMANILWLWQLNVWNNRKMSLDEVVQALQ
jgi:hypothetical protein